MTTILLVAPKHNYGRKSEGYSYEYYNFYDSLVGMGHDVALFDFMGIVNRVGREEMNSLLLGEVSRLHPDVLIAVPHRDEIAGATMRKISDDTQTVSWFSDDHWRFDTHTKYLAPCFTWSVTTDRHSLPKYATIGYKNVIKSQWACNHFLYHPLERPLRYGVTFVGQPHGTRRNSIAAIRAAGIDVRTWGRGWPSGRVTQEEMLCVFAESRINLNLSNASPPRSLTGRVIAALWRLAGSEALSPRARELLFVGIGQLEKAFRPLLPRDTWDPDFERSSDQIKGRNFEVPGCAGFLLTGAADDLDQYYVSDQEVATFNHVAMMIDRLRYYLAKENERAAVARAGYERTIREHTYVHRFTHIFDRMGVESPPVHDVLSGRIAPGRRSEIE